MRRRASSVLVLVATLGIAVQVHAQSSVAGFVADETGGVLPGVSVEVRQDGAPTRTASTDARGQYQVEGLPPGRYELSFALIDFATARRQVDVSSTPARVNVVLQLSLNADVTVTGKRTFANLADVNNPTENLVGIAQSSSQGAYFLDDPVNGDQFHQADHRFVSEGKVSHRRIARWGNRELLNTAGVQLPHLQTSLTLWSLSLESELLFIGDAGGTEAGRPSHRYGVELANYYSPVRWLTFDGLHNWFGSVRLRYFGPRSLIEGIDDVHLHPALPRTARVNLILSF